MNSPRKLQIQLTDEQRTELERLARDGNTPSRKARYARLLLHADSAHPEGCRSDAWIADALGLHLNTVGRIRKEFVTGGLDAAFARKPRETPPVPPKIDGRVQAHLASICCSDPPKGQSRWTLTLLANELKSRGLVTEVSIETVRKALKKTNCSRGGSSAGASPKRTPLDSSPPWSKCSTSMRVPPAKKSL